MLVAVRSTAAAASRRGLLVLRGASISSSVPARVHAIRGLSVIAQPNAYVSLNVNFRSSGVCTGVPVSASASPHQASRCFSSNSTSAAEDAAAGPADVDAKVQREVLDRCEALHASLMPLNEKVRGFAMVHCSII